jgi:hypothetical protein
MTGPEHYAEAERLLTEQVFISGNHTTRRAFAETVAAAQVHATLAAAAAAAIGTSAQDAREWASVAGTRLSGRGADLGVSPSRWLNLRTNRRRLALDLRRHFVPTRIVSLS